MVGDHDPIRFGLAPTRPGEWPSSGPVRRTAGVDRRERRDRVISATVANKYYSTRWL
jgi:hypothetical protein